MAEETLKKSSDTPASAATEVVAIPDVPEAEKSVSTTKKEPESEVPEKSATVEEVAEPVVEEEKIAESASFKEETNVVGELPDPQKVALDELKNLVQEALNKHEFTAPPPPPAPPAKEEEKPAEAPVTEEKAAEAPVTEEKAAEAPVTEEKAAEVPAEKATPAVAEAAVEEPPKSEPEAAAPPPPVEEEKTTPPPPTAAEPSEPVVVVAEVVEKVETADEDGAKTVQAIEETIVAVAAPTPPEDLATTPEAPPAEPQVETAAEPEAPPPPPEEVCIWGIPLLADERSDVILLKFLRARDFKVKEAFSMLKSVVAWRKEFGIEALLEEDFGNEFEKVVFMHGVDKEGHPVCYNAFGEFQNKELYQNAFGDEEKRTKFLRWRIQFLEKSIRKLDFSPDGMNTIVQVIDLKNSPGLFKLRMATDHALQLLQDNYPEFVAKQVVVNVPWWYLAFYRMISPFFTQRTKSKIVFVGPSKTAETLSKYISPEQVPVQYGGLSREGEQEFTTGEPATEEIIKPASKHIIEFQVTETCLLVWEARVVGWDVSYGAEFVPAEGYTIIIQKSRKLGAGDEPVISGSYKASEVGKIVLTFDNQTSKKKKLLYRSKTKSSE